MTNTSYHNYICLLNEKFLKTSNQCPTLEVEPGNILLVERELPLGYNLSLSM